MFFLNPFIFLLIVGLATFVVADKTRDPTVRLDKSPVRENLDYLGPGLETYLNESGFRYALWNNSWIPQDCYTNAINNHVKASELNVYNVYYDDVSASLLI
jgi:hypothetical protein